MVVVGPRFDAALTTRTGREQSLRFSLCEKSPLQLQGQPMSGLLRAVSRVLPFARFGANVPTSPYAWHFRVGEHVQLQPHARALPPHAAGGPCGDHRALSASRTAPLFLDRGLYSGRSEPGRARLHGPALHLRPLHGEVPKGLDSGLEYVRVLGEDDPCAVVQEAEQQLPASNA